MKQLILALCLITLEANTQTIIDTRVTIGVADTLYSNILGETQQFWVSLPTNYDNPRFLRAHYPVIYVFDGDANFSTVASMARQLSVRNGNTVLPEAIVVGIMNNHRTGNPLTASRRIWVWPMTCLPAWILFNCCGIPPLPTCTCVPSSNSGTPWRHPQRMEFDLTPAITHTILT